MKHVFVSLLLASTFVTQGSFAWEVRSYKEALESARNACGYAVDAHGGDPHTPGICRNCQGPYLVLGGTDGTARGQNECASATTAFSANPQVRRVCVNSDYVGSVLGVGVSESEAGGDFDVASGRAVFACCKTMGYGMDLIGCAQSACGIGAQGYVCFSQ